MKLWFLEFKKMFLRTNYIILILVFLIVNGFKIVLSNEFNPHAIDSLNLYNNEGYSETEALLSGTITPENAKKVFDGYNSHIAFIQGSGEYSQENLCYYLLYPRYAYQYDYHLVMEDILNEAEENIAFYNEHNNDYYADVNRLFLRCYDNRYINTYSNNDDFEILFTYNFSTLLLLILSFVFSFCLFYSERRIGMENLLKTSKKGRRRLPIIKISCFAVILIVSALLFYVEDVIVHSIMFHLNDWTAPVYSIESYQFSIYTGSIAGYYICMCLQRIAVLFCTGLIFSLVSLVFQGFLLPVIVNLLIITMKIVLSEQYSEITFSSLTNFAVLLQPDKILKSFNAIKLFNIPLTAAQAGAAIIAIFIIIMIALNRLVYIYDILFRIPKRKKGREK